MKRLNKVNLDIADQLSPQFDSSLRLRHPSVQHPLTREWIWREYYRDICVYARNTSIRVVAFRQIRCHRKTIKRSSRPLRIPSLEPRRPLGKLQIDGVRILFKFARQRGDESGRGRKEDRTRRKFAISKYFSEKGNARWEEENWRDGAGGLEGFKSPRVVLLSWRNCYFNSTFCH